MGKIVNRILNTSFAKRVTPTTASAKLTSRIVLVSAVTKDIVNCAFYTYQSLNNKRIPEDQRKFVGAYDLANGVINVVIQIVMGLGAEQALISLFDKKIAPKYFATDDKVIQKKFENLPKELKEKGLENFKKEFLEISKRNKAIAKHGFTAVAVGVLLQIVTKRMISPFFATPAASQIKKGMEKHDAEQAMRKEKLAMMNNATEAKDVELKELANA